MDEATIERHIRVQYDNRGNPYWKSRTSPPDNSVGVCYMVPDRIIPVIFVPGVMGSNLIGKTNKNNKWLLDDKSSIAVWFTRGAAKRKSILNPDAMKVDGGGKTGQGTVMPEEELKRRYWGEVGNMSYGDALVWLENALNDYDHAKSGIRVALMSLDLGAEQGEKRPAFEEIVLSYRYRFPVHAFGYNWLADNRQSAERLGQRIDEIIGRYRKERKKIEKVILVTHSMGGMVARCCSEVLGYRDKILGIVHGVQPAIGAAATYRRCKAGAESTGGVNGWVTSEILGGNAAEMTAVMSSAPGPLQLLPTPEYGDGWLRIVDASSGRQYSLPAGGDPYGEIYAVRGKWWSLCEDKLMNPLNQESDPAKRHAQTDKDWESFSDIIKTQVRRFHLAIAGKYHPVTHAFYGSGSALNSFGNVTWRGSGGRFQRGLEVDALNARQDNLLGQTLKEDRYVIAKPLPGQNIQGQQPPDLFQVYTLVGPDEAGDGTVPRRSGIAQRAHCSGFLRVEVGHEPAFKPGEGPEYLRACQFTLRAIVDIAQTIKQTSLRYE